MSAGDVLNEVKQLCKEKKYEEAKILIESNKEMIKNECEKVVAHFFHTHFLFDCSQSIHTLILFI
ncbi:hypothetical protein [uncultured Enterococcus sp.]|uniref:hypothetical protein n=1 Tax=uncultured Enterococcus sp. TaxID=167972 RepID=UPI0025922AE2|nr:hypothetical protein [uncultured Enterococcus sp.]